MKTFILNAARFAAVFLTISIFAACDSDNDDVLVVSEEEHEHGSLLVSRLGSNSLSMVDEGELESLGNVGFNSAGFVLSDNGEFVAITGSSSIQFADDEGLLEAAIVGTQVVTTSGHFSILDGGSSTLISLAELEANTATPTTESSADLSLAETYPALVLDEEVEVMLLFAGSNALVYEGDTEVQSYACASPSSVAQAHHAVIITCTEGVRLLQFEEETDGVEYESQIIDVDGTDSAYMWQATDHLFAGYEAGSSNYALIHIEEDDTVETILSSEATTLASNICTAGIESEGEDFLFWLSGGNFHALDNEGVSIGTITVDTSTSIACSDYNMATSEKTALVLDNDAMKFYEIDIDDGAAIYHVHETMDITVSDITAAVALSLEEGDHDHENNEGEHDH